ncbi:MAG TPA: hypothetical protein DIT13_08705, partial [Verrucomicrobiales bacterium]|nr:hypothetical protein [Verrucomicrobiales bacterium]
KAMIHQRLRRLLLPMTAMVFACLIPSCGSRPGAAIADPAFAKVAGVLEANCVHCHGDNRLSHMPPINDSAELARLVGSNAWIVPGKPECSRFFQVVTFGDAIPGAMPPTGHAIARQDVAILRHWITEGARIPEGRIISFHPRGKRPRSE